MTESIRFDRAPDPLYARVPLHHVLELPVLGVPLRFESNSAAVLEAVEAGFGVWRALRAHPDLIAATGARCRIIVHEGDEGGAAIPEQRWRRPAPDLLLFHTTGSVGVVDALRREAVAYVTPALLANPAFARLGLLPGIVLTLVTTCDRVPLHAAAVARGPVALLLAGPPGTGKSTLAHAAAAHGLRVLSDDAAYIQTTPEFRLWGVPGRVMLLEPEGDAKRALVHPDAWPAPGAAPPIARQVGVCLLERNGGAARLVRMDAAALRAALRDGVAGSSLQLGDAMDAALAWLVPTRGWRLSLSGDPEDAVPLIEQMLSVVAAGGR